MENNCKLISLTYISTPSYDISFLGLLRLLGHSFLNNQSNKITGFLILRNNQFAQILEGEEDAVSSVWFKIQQDYRHQNIQFLSKEYIDKRSFSKWSMLFPESEKGIKYFPDMAEAVQGVEIPVNHTLFKIIAE